MDQETPDCRSDRRHFRFAGPLAVAATKAQRFLEQVKGVAGMRLGVIEVGRPPEPLGKVHGHYPAMFEALLKPAMPDLEIQVYRAIDGDIPTSTGGVDGWLVTGSAFGVYDPEPWIAEVRDFGKRLLDDGAPTVGICFGHQILAQAAGGRAEKSEKGWGVGRHEYDIVARPEWMADAPRRFATYVSHQDQVVEAPLNAAIIARSNFCSCAMLQLSETCITLQSHPEMPRDFVADLYELRRDRIGSERVDEALSEIDSRIDAGLVATWISRFYRSARARVTR